MRRLPLICALALLAAVLGMPGTAPAAPSCTITWDGGSGGSWHTDTNWSTDQLPGPNDHVCITTGSVEFSAGFTSVRTIQASAPLTVSGGTLTLTDTVETSTATSLTLSGGTIAGAGRLDLSGAPAWSAGTMTGAGETRVLSGSTLTVTDCTAALSGGRTLTNAGTVSFVEQASIFAFDDDVPPAIDNSGSLVIDDSVASACSESGVGGNALIHNTGTISKLGGAGTALLDGTVDNDGSLEVSSGGLRLSALTPATQSGSFSTSGVGSNVVFDVGTFTFEAGASITGQAKVGFAELAIPSGVTMSIDAGSSLMLDGARITGGGTLAIAGTLDWLAGQQEDGGLTLIEPSGQATLGGPSALLLLASDRQLVNRGQTTLVDGTLHLFGGASVLNTGTLEIDAAAEIQGSGFGFFGSLLHNAGLLRKVGAGDSVVVSGVENDGTIEVVGGSLALRALLNSSLETESLAGGAYIARAGATLVVPGPVEQLAARLLLDGAGSSVGFAVSPGDPVQDALEPLARVAGNGALELAGGRDLGTTAGLQVAGTVDLGPGSVLTVNGPYQHQGAGSLLLVGVAGPASSQHGRLTAAGGATLAGIVSFETDPAFSAGPGTQLAVAGFASRSGTYGEAKGLDPPGPPAFDLQYSDTEMTLVVASASRVAGQSGDQQPPAAPASGAARVVPILIDDRELVRSRGSWTRTRRGARTLTVAAAPGATLASRKVRGRTFALLAETCRRCGGLEVFWRGRLVRRISLRSSRRRIRLLPITTLRLPETGVLRLRTTSARRAAIDALLVTPG